MESLRERYLTRKGYCATSGHQFVFAHKDAISKAVAFFDGTYGREAHKAVMAEVKHLGLETVTVLVNGLVTYSGPGFTAIRVDTGYEASFTAQELENDLVADIRLAKRQLRGQLRR